MCLTYIELVAVVVKPYLRSDRLESHRHTGTPALVAEYFHEYPQSLHANAWILPPLGQDSFLPNVSNFLFIYPSIVRLIQDVLGGKVNILGSRFIEHSKQKLVYLHVFYSERFPRYSYFTVR
jgi:hypothetical protein